MSLKNELVKLHLVAVVITILLTRLALYVSWQQTWMDGMKEDSWHHAYTGALLLPLIWISFRKYKKFRSILSGIALGLIVDELNTFLCFFDYHIDYWSIGSWGTAIVFLCIYTGYYLKTNKFNKY